MQVNPDEKFNDYSYRSIELWCRCLYVIDLIVVIPGKNKSSGLFESAAGIEERNDKKLLYIDNTFIDIDNSILI
jgi:hypothetical protein